MNQKWHIIVVLLVAGACSGRAALALTGNSYSENFDDVGSGLSTGWDVYSSATSSSLGSATTFNTTMSTWTQTGEIVSGGFWNIASSDGLTLSSDATAQNGSTDRAIGFRQVGTGGLDPGAAVVLNIQNTAGLGNFALSVKIQLLADNGRSTDLVLDYRIGDTGGFTTLTTFTDPNTFGSTTVSFNSTDLGAWNNQSSDIWFRIAAVDASTGSGSRDTFGVDDFSLTYSAVPEPAAWGAISALGLLIICGVRTWRQRYASCAF
jgi:hypothetical protein